MKTSNDKIKRDNISSSNSNIRIRKKYYDKEDDRMVMGTMLISKEAYDATREAIVGCISYIRKQHKYLLTVLRNKGA